MTDSSTTACRTDRPWGESRPASWGFAALVAAVAVVLTTMTPAVAFPLIDPSNQDQVPQGIELAPTDVQDLRHQLQIVNGLGSTGAGGWKFVPRIDFQELLTDNVREQHSPRQWDLVSYLSPGFNLLGDLPRLSLNLSYAPTLAIYTQNGDLNALTQQLNAVGLITVVPELAYVDVRAVSGVQNANGGLGGLGGVGASTIATAQSTIPSLAGSAEGLTRDNEVQTSSISISPYLLNRFGDWGIGRLGYSLNATRSDTLSGFAAPPYPSGGINGQTLISNEETAHFVTGDILQQLEDTFDADLLQSQTNTDANADTLFGGFPASAGSSDSRRVVINDQLTYKLSRSFAVFASGGHEDITYSNQNPQSVSAVTLGNNGIAIHDLTWSLGITWTPDAESKLTLSYGHQNGFNSISANGYYDVTARTLLSVSYGSTLGTQLETVQNQLNLATPSSNGTLVNGQNGGPLFGATNALPVQNGVYRTDTLVIGSQTTLDRDIITLSLLVAQQTSSGATAVSSRSSAKTFGGTWLHELSPDMTLNAGLSFSIQDQSVTSGVTSGNSTSIVATLGWQYQISDTLTASLRYSLFERQSAVTAFDFVQNILIAGLTKRF